MRKADLQVRRFANSFELFQMWQLYREEAPGRGWPVWPYYVHVALILQLIPNVFLILLLIKR